MNLLACYKIVYEEQDIAVSASGGLNFDRAELKLSLYDLNALEAAARLAESTGGAVKALSVGNTGLDNSKLQKSVLSRGASELFLVKDAALADPDTQQTAAVLAAAAAKIGFDLIVCGEGSADAYAQQTGIQLGELLGVSVINAVNKITPLEGRVLVERSLEDTVEFLEVPLPAVICVTSDINEPRVPGMKDILAAGKKPVTVWNLSDTGVTAEKTVEVVSILAPAQAERKQMLFEGEDKLPAFFDAIKNELK